MEIKEITLNDDNVDELIELSRKWKEENISLGIVEDTIDDLKDKRIFVCELDGKIVGEALAHITKAGTKNIGSVIDDDEDVLEIDALYVLKQYRNKGIGKALFKYIEEYNDVDNIVLSTSTKDYQKILHFYIDELGMSFHSAFLYKKNK